MLERTNDGVELTYNLSEPRNHSYVVNGVVVRNCSEYVHLDNSACNLASMNLLTFLDENDEFDVEGFKAGVAVVFTGAGDHRRQRRLPDREDRRDDARLPGARHRLRQPGRAAHGAGPALRLRRRPGLGGRHHGAVDGARLRHVGPHRGPHGTLRRLPRQRRADAQRPAHAPGRGGPHRRGRRAARTALGGPGVLGPGGRPGRGLRRAQLAGQRFGPDWNHWLAHGL